MKSAVLIVAIAALSCLGCRKQSLSPDSGRAVQEALADQRASADEGKATGMSAEDAKVVLDAHYNGPASSDSGKSSSTSSFSSGAALMPPPSTSGGASGGSDGIRLRAK